MRYAPRLIPNGSAPPDTLVEPLIANPPASPLGEHALIPEVAWMVERDGVFVHLPASARAELDDIRGLAIETTLDDELTNEPLEHLPGVNFATTGAHAAELLIDRDHLAAIHDTLKGAGYFVGVPRRGRCLVGGIGAGVDGTRRFVEYVRQEYEAAPPSDRISPVTLFVRDGEPRSAIGELQLAALAQAAGK